MIMKKKRKKNCKYHEILFLSTEKKVFLLKPKTATFKKNAHFFI